MGPVVISVPVVMFVVMAAEVVVNVRRTVPVIMRTVHVVMRIVVRLFIEGGIMVDWGCCCCSTKCHSKDER